MVKNSLETLKILENGSAHVRALILHTRDEPVRAGKDGIEYLTEPFLKQVQDRYNREYKSFLGIGKKKFPKVVLEHAHEADEVVGRLDSKIKKDTVYINDQQEAALFADIYITDPGTVKQIENGDLYQVSAGLYHDTQGYYLKELSLTQDAEESNTILLKSNSADDSAKVRKIAESLEAIQAEINERNKEVETKTNRLSKEAILLNAVKQNKLTRADKEALFDKVLHISDNTLKEIFRHVAPNKLRRHSLFSQMNVSQVMKEQEKQQTEE
jgi:hypothetical protein